MIFLKLSASVRVMRLFRQGYKRKRVGIGSPQKDQPTLARDVSQKLARSQNLITVGRGEVLRSAMEQAHSLTKTH